ncbi:MAG: putative basic amino acid antiporter YfcC [Rhodothermales bacterium]|nr:putative basic amino acid antiporter YfcC [Rhodothermales bacterium]
MSKSLLDRIKVPHVFTLLTGVVLFCSLLTYLVPSGSYDREAIQVGSLERNVIVPDSFERIPKVYSAKGLIFGQPVEGQASPVSLEGFLSAIPRGMEAAADIIFFIFVLGGVFGILQRTGTIIAGLHKLLGRFRDSGPLLTIVLMTSIAVGGSTLGMGEEFIPLVPLFLLVSKELGYDRIFGLALVMVAADVGFAAATTNPFTVNIAQGIAELPLNSLIPFRLVFLVSCLAVTLTYVLRYGARVKKDPSASVMPDDDFDLSHHDYVIEEFNRRHLIILVSCVVIFGFILFAIQEMGWWLAEMGGGFILMGLVAIVVSGLSLTEAAKAAVKGMEEMVVAALVVGFARAIQVVLDDGQILDTLIYSAAGVLQHLPSYLAAAGMLGFQTVLNFFIPSGSGQAAVTMPLMAPLADVLGLTRQTAVFAFTCGDGFSNTIVPTSGVLMAMLSLAGIPWDKWLKFMLPLFLQLMALSTLFLFIVVALGLE